MSELLMRKAGRYRRQITMGRDRSTRGAAEDIDGQYMHFIPQGQCRRLIMEENYGRDWFCNKGREA